MDHDCCLFTVLLAIPVAVLLSQWIGVLGWACLSSMRISCIILASLQLMNRAASSASAADATTHLRMPQKVKMDPLIWMGSCGFGCVPKK